MLTLYCTVRWGLFLHVLILSCYLFTFSILTEKDKNCGMFYKHCHWHPRLGEN